jgi:hypothetical protein
MSKKTSGLILVIVGVIILVVALFADSLGIGGSPGFGYRQWLMAGAGIIVALVGAGLVLWKPGK